MKEKTLNITTKDGEMESFAVHPDGSEPFPAVILYMDAPGIREELRDFCRRIAGRGLYVLLPDMYYRLGKLRWDLKGISDSERKSMMAAMNSLTIDLVMRDTEAMLQFLGSEGEVKPGPKGCIGYCMSGRYVVAAAGNFPEDFAAAASLYGVGIVSDAPDSPHRLAGKIKGELYFGFAENDEYVPENVIPDLKAALDEHGVPYRLDVWPGTGHGFCFPGRDAYREEQAEGVWELVLDLYKRRLG